MKQAASFLIVLLLFTISSNAQNASLRIKQFNIDKNHLAIEGYDPVSYFTIGKAEKGKKEFTITADGLTYQFSSAKNKELFKNNYAKYEPQYGGWCAYGASRGYKAPTEPATYAIINNKLYFNYNMKVKELWDKNRQAYIDSANVKWPSFKNN